MTPFIIPFFLTHQGCPHRCLYCNQRLSGRPQVLTREALARGVAAGLASKRRRPEARVEVAFYGGTFTALARRRQEELLGAVAPFLQQGLVQGLRLSTRPDALSDGEIEFLKARGVSGVEIGAQSLDETVLKASRRGHTAAQTRAAARRVKAAGLSLGLQLLFGLPGEDKASRAKTLAAVLELAPEEARLYPLLVLKDTPLAELYRQGLYQPLSLDQAVTACARAELSLTRNKIRVIRLGLQASPELEEGLVAGPYHPGFGHLVKARIFYWALARALQARPDARTNPSLAVAPQDLAQALGHRRENLARLTARFRLPDLTLQPDPGLSRGRFRWQGQVFSVYEAPE